MNEGVTAPAPAMVKRRGARVDTVLRHIEEKLRPEERAPRPLTIDEMKVAIVRDPDPYRDWRAAYEADIRRGSHGRVVHTGTWASNRSPLPRR